MKKVLKEYSVYFVLMYNAIKSPTHLMVDIENKLTPKWHKLEVKAVICFNVIQFSRFAK